MAHGYFSFERLDAHKVAWEALRMGMAERGGWKRLPGDLADQAERALLSVVANIAEGAGRESKPDQKRLYAIARASANEAGVHLELIAVCGGLSAEVHAAIRSRLIRVIQMLNAMIRK